MSGSLRRLAAYGLGLGAAAFAAADAAELYSTQGTVAGRFQDNIKLPLDLDRDPRTPYMSMRFREYYRRSIRDQPFFRDVMNIRLPVPSNLVEQTSLNYEKDKHLGSALGSAVEGLSRNSETMVGFGGMQGIGSIAAGVGTAAISRAARGTAAQQEAANELGINRSQLVNDLAAATSVLTGVTTNPFQVVLFKNPHFRSHQFTWKFIPQSQQESDELKKLIDTFRYHSLPGISAAGGVFFSYPEILEINFRPTDHYLYKFKPCVVETITVNYAPNGPSFFKSSGAPAAIQIDIRVQEIEIWTKADDMRVNGRYGRTLTQQEIRAREEQFRRANEGAFDALGNPIPR